MIALAHIFLPNLRFDTDVEYLSVDNAQARYQKLPVRKGDSEAECAATSALQWLALSGQTPRWRLLSHRRRLSAALRASRVLNSEAVVRCLQMFDDDVTFCAASQDDLGARALWAMEQGRACLVWYASARRESWACMTGVEVEQARGTDRPRTLLLLDAHASEPWACGHNVRIELDPDASYLMRPSEGYPLACRHLSGEASAVRLLGLIWASHSPREADRPLPGSSPGSRAAPA